MKTEIQKETIKVQCCPKCKNLDVNFLLKKAMEDNGYDICFNTYTCSKCKYQITRGKNDVEIGKILVDISLGIYCLPDSRFYRERIAQVVGKRTTQQILKAMEIIGSIQYKFNKRTGLRGWCH